jgi:HD-like signal output (HDOD) protein
LTPTHAHRSDISKEDIIKAAGAPGALGAGANSARRVLGVLYKPDVSARDVGTVVSQAPGLTANVLRVANSAYYAQSHSVSTIERAVALLGLDMVRTIAAAACMRDSVMRSTPPSIYDNAALIQHSVATALATDALSRIIHPPLAAEAFVAGLLHDLGIAVQARLCPDGMAAIVQAIAADPTQAVESLEADLVTVGHARCAAVVFDEWKLPTTLIAAVKHHHDPEAAPEQHQRLTALVHLGNHVSLTSGYGFPGERMSAGLQTQSLATLGLTPADIDTVAAALPEQLSIWQRALAGA